MRNNIDYLVGEETKDKAPLTDMVKDNQLVCLTPQILVDSLKSGIGSLSQFTLFVFDECHHAKEGHPCQRVMDLYLDEKLEQGNHARLPQVGSVAIDLRSWSSKIFLNCRYSLICE